MRIVVVSVLALVLAACGVQRAVGVDAAVIKPDAVDAAVVTSDTVDADVVNLDVKPVGPLPPCDTSWESSSCVTATFKPCFVDGPNCGWDTGFTNRLATCRCVEGKVSCKVVDPSQGKPCSEIPPGKSCSTGELMTGGLHCTCTTGGTWDCTEYQPPDFGVSPPPGPDSGA